MTTMFLGLGVVLMPMALGFGPPRDEKADAEALSKLDGNWEPTSSTNDGKVADLKEVPKLVLVLEEGRMAAVGRGKMGYGTVKVDVGHDPARVVWRYGDSPAKTGTSLGIYKLDGDTLSVCTGALDPETGRSRDRPKVFESRPGSGTILLVYKRVKAEIRMKDLHFPADLIEPPTGSR